MGVTIAAVRPSILVCQSRVGASFGSELAPFRVFSRFVTKSEFSEIAGRGIPRVNDVVAIDHSYLPPRRLRRQAEASAPSC